MVKCYVFAILVGFVLFSTLQETEGFVYKGKGAVLKAKLKAPFVATAIVAKGIKGIAKEAAIRKWESAKATGKLAAALIAAPILVAKKTAALKAAAIAVPLVVAKKAAVVKVAAKKYAGYKAGEALAGAGSKLLGAGGKLIGSALPVASLAQGPLLNVFINDSRNSSQSSENSENGYSEIKISFNSTNGGAFGSIPVLKNLALPKVQITTNQKMEENKEQSQGGNETTRIIYYYQPAPTYTQDPSYYVQSQSSTYYAPPAQEYASNDDWSNNNYNNW